MDRKVKIAIGISVLTVALLVSIYSVSYVLHKRNNVTQTVVTYEELTNPDNLTVTITIDTNSAKYYDAEYLFREYIADNGIESGDITLDYYVEDAGSGNLTIGGVLNGVDWSYTKENTGKE